MLQPKGSRQRAWLDCLQMVTNIVNQKGKNSLFPHYGTLSTFHHQKMAQRFFCHRCWAYCIARQPRVVLKSAIPAKLVSPHTPVLSMNCQPGYPASCPSCGGLDGCLQQGAFVICTISPRPFARRLSFQLKLNAGWRNYDWPCA